MRLSLLRGSFRLLCYSIIAERSERVAPTAPDDKCDQGTHEFAFAIAPHDGTFAESSIPQAAILFNNPLHLRTRSTTSSNDSKDVREHSKMFSVRGDRNVFLETIKRGEEDHFGSSKEARGHDKTVVLRIYEAYGGRGVSELLTFVFPPSLFLYLTLLRFSHLKIKSIKIVDILERAVVGAPVLKVDESNEGYSAIKFTMRGFEVLTIMVTVAG